MLRTGTTSVRMLQAVSLVVSFAVLLWTLGLPMLNVANAQNLTSVSDTLSDSDLGVVSNHTIRFTIPTGSVGLAAGEAITITFPNGFNIATSSVDFTDVDVLVNGSNQTLAASPSGGTWGISTSTHDLIITSGTSTLAADDDIVVYVGTNATSGTTGNQQITNDPQAGSYELNISTPVDSGATRIVIIDDVQVTASVDTIFDFTITGFTATGVNVNGTTTNATTSSTAIPFGTLTANNVKTAAQRLNVSTNAANGFVVTVQQSGNLQSITGADIDAFIDGDYTNSPAPWQAPIPALGDENTYGHWGVTSSDDLNSDEFGNNLWVAASTTPREVFAATSSADGTTANVGSTTVGYQVEISALQEAAEDYETFITYVATPTF